MFHININAMIFPALSERAAKEIVGGGGVKTHSNLLARFKE